MAEHDGRLLEALEQLQNDERLTSDLTDEGARVVLAWLEDEIRAANTADERTFRARVQALRVGVKQVARAHADDPQALIAAAKAAALGIMSDRPAPGASGGVSTAASPRPAVETASSPASMSQLSDPNPRKRPWTRRPRRMRRRGSGST